MPDPVGRGASHLEVLKASSVSGVGGFPPSPFLRCPLLHGGEIMKLLCCGLLKRRTLPEMHLK